MSTARQPGPDANSGNSGPPDSSDRLDSWKAVASYLGRSDKTVRRWEEKEGLPIHRLHHDKRGSIYAYKRELDIWWESRKATLEIEETPPATSEQPRRGVRHITLHQALLVLACCLALAAAVLAGLWLGSVPQPSPGQNVQFSRITDSVGREDSPAISPDGKMVAFVARTGGRRHVWVRLLAGGVPIQITRDDADHEQPRWVPDSSSLIYYSPSPTPGEHGTVWEIPALGGPPRRLADALGGGDCSHDGRRIALFRSESGRTDLVTVDSTGSGMRHVTEVPSEDLNEQPRWSPDDRWIAFKTASGSSFDERIYVVPAAGGKPRAIARGEDLRGMTWLGDGSGLVYSSSAGSTILYPAIFNLRMVRLNGGGDRQLTFGDVSYIEPDLHPSGELAVSRIRSEVDIWKFPINGKPDANTRRAVRITAQTGQVQTPSLSPNGQEMVYLSDSGGHGNLWVAKTDGSTTRQITFERDPAIAVGVPVWSPAGNQIVFILTQQGRTAQWLINSDGSGLRQLVPMGIWAYWSTDGRWVYYVVIRNGVYCIEKISVEGGTPIVVRSDNAVAPAATDGSLLYYATLLNGGNGSWDFEFRKASPENGHYEVLTRIAGARVPHEALNFHMILSPDGKWLATPLTDGTTTNLWLLPAGGGPIRQVTDFGERPILIVRRVSWSPDGKYLYAAVADCGADIVMFHGLIP